MTGRPDGERYTDLGNARRLVSRFGADLRFVPAWDCWLVWDGSRWARDTADTVMLRAKETVRALYSDGARISDDEERGRLLRHAMASERLERLRAMVVLARSEPGVVVRAEDLDADPWKFNCVNGTLDLPTGRLMAHCREHLITKRSPVSYDPTTRSSVWTGFLERVTGGCPQLQQFLQRAVGYTLTGSTAEEVLLFLLGGTASGKSTFIEAIRAVLGEYAVAADFETLLRQNQSRGPRNDIARLAGARLVTAVEVPAGRQLDEAVVKSLTGGDRITARFLHREHFEFVPQFTLWLAANHRPSVRDDDPAIWRRLLVVPFTRTIPEAERDPRVKAQLRDPADAGPAVLAWAVEGCLQWQRDGLGAPDAVRSATTQYRDDVATFSVFVEEECDERADAWVASNEVVAAFGIWSSRNGYRYPMGPRAIADRLRSRGHSSGKRHGVRGWNGIRLKPTAGVDGWTDRAIVQVNPSKEEGRGTVKNSVLSAQVSAGFVGTPAGDPN